MTYCIPKRLYTTGLFKPIIRVAEGQASGAVVSVNYCVFHACGIVAKFETRSLFLCLKMKNEKYSHRCHVYEYNNGRVMARFLIIAPCVLLYFEQVHLGNRSSY